MYMYIYLYSLLATPYGLFPIGILAIAALHSNEICHRDIKPDNFMVSGEQLKLCDFGLAIRPSYNERLRVRCGTPAFMPPARTARPPVPPARPPVPPACPPDRPSDRPAGRPAVYIYINIYIYIYCVFCYIFANSAR